MASLATERMPLEPKKTRPPDWMKGQGAASWARHILSLGRTAGPASWIPRPPHSVASVIYEEEREKQNSGRGNSWRILLSRPVAADKLERRRRQAGGAGEEENGMMREKENRSGNGSGRELWLRPGWVVAEHTMVVLPPSSFLLLLNFIFTACEKFHKAQFHFPFPPLPGICPPRGGRTTPPR